MTTSNSYLTELKNTILKLKIMSSEKVYKYMQDIFINRFCKSEIITIDNKKYIILYKEKSTIEVSSILYIENTSIVDYELAKSILNGFEKLGKKYDLYNYKLISFNGYVEDNFIYELENFNMCLEDSRYIEMLLDEDKNIYRNYVELMAHNKYTYRSIKQLFSTQKRVCSIQATGTGKSYLAGKCALDFKEENKLILSSSYYILQQFETNFAFLKEKTKLVHYAKLSKVDESWIEELKNFNPKLIILDEFHRAGAEEWERGVKRVLNLFPEAYILGTSATPIRYLDNNRDMSKELFNKNIANEINLFDALVKKILPMPKYVQAFFEIEKEIDNINEKIKKSQNTKKQKLKFKDLTETLVNKFDTVFDAAEVLKKYITTERKFIIFCRDYSHMEEMVTIVTSWFEEAFNTKNVEIFKVSSQYIDSDQELNSFISNDYDKSNNFKLLFAIDKMNEGVHAPSVEGLILLRPTTSPIIYFQQIGRCLQTNKGKKPLIFDFVNNSNNIQSIAFEKNIISAFEKNNTNREKIGLDSTPPEDLNNLITEIHDETVDVLEMLKQIEDNLSIGWDAMFEQLKKIYLKTEKYSIPNDSKYRKLIYWTNAQRIAYKNKSLKKDRLEKLESIGFLWCIYDYAWEEQYLKLVEYYKEHGTSIIPKSYENTQLYTWVGAQRKLMKSGEVNELSQNRIDKLNKIEFVWDMGKDIWEKKYNEAIAFYKKHGHLNIKIESEYKTLAKWMQTQRLDYKNNTLSKEKIKKLKKINFVWDTRHNRWLDEYDKLKKLKEEFGNCDVDMNYEDNKLYKWVIKQRINRTRGILLQDRIDLLNQLDFTWNVSDVKWEAHYKELEAYFLQYSNTVVKEEYSNSALVQWTVRQRSEYKKGTLDISKIEKLNKLDFQWDLLEYRWNELYENLKEYKSIYKSIKVPKSYKNGKLQAWVNKQRRDYAKDAISEEHIDKLNEIGFIWNTEETAKREKGS